MTQPAEGAPSAPTASQSGIPQEILEATRLRDPAFQDTLPDNLERAAADAAKSADQERETRRELQGDASRADTARVEDETARRNQESHDQSRAAIGEIQANRRGIAAAERERHQEREAATQRELEPQRVALRNQIFSKEYDRHPQVTLEDREHATALAYEAAQAEVERADRARAAAVESLRSRGLDPHGEYDQLAVTAARKAAGPSYQEKLQAEQQAAYERQQAEQAAQEEAAQEEAARRSGRNAAAVVEGSRRGRGERSPADPLESRTVSRPPTTETSSGATPPPTESNPSGDPDRDPQDPWRDTDPDVTQRIEGLRQELDSDPDALKNLPPEMQTQIKLAIDELAKRENRYESQAGKWRRGRQQKKYENARDKLRNLIEQSGLDDGGKMLLAAQTNLQVAQMRMEMGPNKDNFLYRVWNNKGAGWKALKWGTMLGVPILAGAAAAFVGVPAALTVAFGWGGAAVVKGAALGMASSTLWAGLKRMTRNVNRKEGMDDRQQALLENQMHGATTFKDFAAKWNQAKSGQLAASRGENDRERAKMQRRGLVIGALASLGIASAIQGINGSMGDAFHFRPGDGLASQFGGGGDVHGTWNDGHPGADNNGTGGGDTPPPVPGTEHLPPAGSGLENMSQAQMEDAIKNALAHPNDPGSQALFHELGIDPNSVDQASHQLANHYHGQYLWDSLQNADHLSDATNLKEIVGGLNDLQANHGFHITMGGDGAWQVGHGGPDANTWYTTNVTGEAYVTTADGHVLHFDFNGAPDNHQMAALIHSMNEPGAHVYSPDQMAHHLAEQAQQHINGGEGAGATGADGTPQGTGSEVATGDTQTPNGSEAGGADNANAGSSAAQNQGIIDQATQYLQGNNNGAESVGNTVGGSAGDAVQMLQAQSILADPQIAQVFHTPNMSVATQASLIGADLANHSSQLHNLTPAAHNYLIQQIVSNTKIPMNQVAALVDANS